jgi:hypothetical protein
MTAHQGFLRRYSRSRITVEAAVADNCRFDERAGPDRWRRFDSLLSDLVADPAEIDWEDWTEANRLHLDGYCNVPSVSVPDTFLQINQSAWLDSLSDNQSLVRIESLVRALTNSNLDIDNLKELLHQADNGDGDADRAVRSFFDDWNWRRDARPAFAAFYDEVQQEADDDDWPHALRDRLGLGDYGDVGGAALPVALMRYSLEDVFSARVNRGLSAACALPSVLDGGMHEFFFPVPREHPYGATVHLLPGRADTLTAEIVHCRIDYQRKHLYGLGTITRPHRSTDDSLRRARDLHLLALQLECAREDFGETLKGRT